MREREALLVERLGATSVFADLDGRDLIEIARAGVRRSLKKRQRLYARGEGGDALVLVCSGRVDLVRGDAVLRSLSAGAVFGFSTLAGASHSADVVAAEASEVFIIGGRHMRALFSRRPEIAMRMLAELGRVVSEISDEVEQLRHADVLERARKKILQLSRGRRELAITHAELAQQIGATRANTSRALKKLEGAGMIRRRRGRIELR